MKLINEFNLQEVYGTSIKEELLKNLDGAITIEDTREGGFGFNPIVSVKLGVEDEDPERSMKMNQFILDELDFQMESLNAESSEETLELLQSRLSKNEEDLKKAEQDLNSFQNKYGILEVDAQVSSMIENIGQVKSKILEKEIEIQVMKDRLNSNSSTILELKTQLNALNITYDDLIKKSENLDNTGSDVFFPLLDLPDLLIIYYRLIREVEIQQSIYEFLLPQIEQQSLYLENNSSGIRLIDEPDLPTYKFKPKRAFIVIGGFMFSIFISLIIIFYKEMTSSEDSETSLKIRKIKQELFNVE